MECVKSVCVWLGARDECVKGLGRNKGSVGRVSCFGCRGVGGVGGSVWLAWYRIWEGGIRSVCVL